MALTKRIRAHYEGFNCKWSHNGLLSKSFNYPAESVAKNAMDAFVWAEIENSKKTLKELKVNAKDRVRWELLRRPYALLSTCYCMSKVSGHQLISWETGTLGSHLFSLELYEIAENLFLNISPLHAMCRNRATLETSSIPWSHWILALCTHHGAFMIARSD